MRDRFINALLACATAAGLIYGLLGHNSPWAVFVMLLKPVTFLRAIRTAMRAGQDEQLVEQLKRTGDVSGMARVAFDKHGGHNPEHRQ